MVQWLCELPDDTHQKAFICFQTDYGYGGLLDDIYTHTISYGNITYELLCYRGESLQLSFTLAENSRVLAII